MGPLLFRVLFLFSVVGGYRPARSPVDISNDEVDSAASHDQKETGNKMWEASQRIVFLKPHKEKLVIGLHYSTATGRILRVDPGSAAEMCGFKEEEYIVELDDEPFSMAACVKAFKQVERAEAVKFTLETPPAAVFTLRQIGKVMDIPSGLVGTLLTMSVPWLLAKAWVGGLEVSPENLNKSVMFSVLGAITLRACRDCMVLCVEWSYVGVRTKLFVFGMLAEAIAIPMICLRNRRNPLLDTTLRADLAAELRKMDCVLWVMCIGFALFRCIRAVLAHAQQGLLSAPVLDILRECASVPVGFGLLIAGRIVSRMATAARQALIEVSEKLPCEAELFEQEVHKPCGSVLKDTSQKLATCGGPLLGLAFELAMSMFKLYEQVVYMAGFRFSVWLSFPEYLMGLAARVCWIAGAASALVVPFLQLSRGQRALERGLWKTRKDDSALHVQVQAVESMLAEVNDGQGWGFPVFVGLVLTKPLMQTLFLRALLAGTVIKAFLDHELGLEEEEGLDVSAQMFTIAGGLQRNISGSLQNQSSAVKDLLANFTT